MSPVRPGALRELAGLGCWVGVAACWTLQVFTPWADRGLLGGGSPLRWAGVAGEVGGDRVPGAAAYVVLVLPLLGCLLLAFALLRGVVWWMLRGLLWLIGTAIVVALIVAVGRLSPGGWGAGPVLGLLGAVLGLVALPLGRRRPRPRVGGPGPMLGGVPHPAAQGAPGGPFHR